jgi:hypothetical protein
MTAQQGEALTARVRRRLADLADGRSIGGLIAR